jgi:trimethylamine--corrinoid protein Co-methyltransferase
VTAPDQAGSAAPADGREAASTGRSGRRARRDGGGVRRLPWTRLVNPHAPVAMISPDQIDEIHRASLRLLADTGMRVLSADARARYAAGGCAVDGETMMVRIDPDLVGWAVGVTPGEFTLHARNPARSILIGGRSVVFSSVGGPAFCSDLERGRRSGTSAEQAEFLKVIQSLDIVHQEGGGPFEALDLPAETRHLDLNLSLVRLLDKTWQGIALGRDRAADSIDMAAIALGTDRDGLAERPAVLAIVNTNSPLTLDVPMAEGLIELAGAGQAVCVTPFTLAGAMAPATVGGALVLQNAEVLAGAVLAQLVRPGTPFVYGSFTSNVDMRSGSPAFGTPEYTKAAQASGQLARHYGMPFRSSNVTTANAVDAQATYESAMSLWGAVMGGANLVYHAAGWLEGGLTASFEKLIIDAEMLQMIAEYLRPLTIDDDALGVEAITAVGPGGHFFGSPHTMQRYETAFYAPMLSDWRNFESWSDAGSVDATQRAHAIWKQLLAGYEQPPLDPAIDAALVDFVARRKRQLTP